MNKKKLYENPNWFRHYHVISVFPDKNSFYFVKLPRNLFYTTICCNKNENDLNELFVKNTFQPIITYSHIFKIPISTSKKIAFSRL